MSGRYIVSILEGAGSPAHVAETNQIAPTASRATIDLGSCLVVIETPDGPIHETLTIDTAELPNRLLLTEGVYISTGTSGLLQSGTYNQLIMDAEARTVCLHNDTLGMLPCYFATTAGQLTISNSLRLLRAAADLSFDELGVAETFALGGWAIFERTILRGARRAAAGTAYRFRLGSAAEPEAERLTNAWTATTSAPLANVIEKFCGLWDAAIARHFDPLDEPIGVLLSGGLDSRLVAGGVAARGQAIVAMSHGDLASDEVAIAGEVAAAVGALRLSNGLDDSFPFGELALDDVNRRTEALLNPMWDSSARQMAANGVASFTTGAGFDVVFGGQKDSNPRLRLRRNLRQALFGPPDDKNASAEDLAKIIALYTGQARKRARNYAPLLAEPYRTLVNGTLADMADEVAARVEQIAGNSPTAPQVLERFIFDHRLRQFTPMQERQLLAYGKVYLPTYDRDLLGFITNLPPGIKYDHHLYYHVIRRLYPNLARIRVTNLGTGVDKSQLMIEMTRAWRIWRKTRLTSWVNFDRWIRLGNRLQQYEKLFLDQPHFFDSAAIRTFFADVREGRRQLYDGNETLAFLNLAWLLDERRQPALRPTEINQPVTTT
jgi:hypothetical protein